MRKLLRHLRKIIHNREHCRVRPKYEKEAIRDESSPEATVEKYVGRPQRPNHHQRNLKAQKRSFVVKKLVIIRLDAQISVKETV